VPSTRFAAASSAASPAALGFELLDLDGRGEPIGYGVAVCRGCVRQAAQTALEVLDMGDWQRIKAHTLKTVAPNEVQCLIGPACTHCGELVPILLPIARVREAREHVREALRLLEDEHHLVTVRGGGESQGAWLLCLGAHIDRLQEVDWLPLLEHEGVVLNWGRS